MCASLHYFPSAKFNNTESGDTHGVWSMICVDAAFHV